MKRDKIDNEIDKILESRINTERINTSPFFTTRVMGKVEQIEVRPKFSLSTYILKPAFVLLLLVNVFNFYFFRNQQQENTDSDDIELLTTDYAYASDDFILNEDLISKSVN